jgi:hypothetical protein
MNTFKRSGNKWSINEVLQLQREYELLEWTVQEIANKHQRSVNAIMFRLEDEGFINSWAEARGYQMGSDCNIKYDIEEKNDVSGGDDNNSEYVCGDDENSWNECDDNSSIQEPVGDDNTITSSDRINDRLDAIEETLANIKEMLATILANTQQKNANFNLRNDLPDPEAICKPWM